MLDQVLNKYDFDAVCMTCYNKHCQHKDNQIAFLQKKLAEADTPSRAYEDRAEVIIKNRELVDKNRELQKKLNDLEKASEFIARQSTYEIGKLTKRVLELEEENRALKAFAKIMDG